jgi:HK97 family phage major capsid protein
MKTIKQILMLPFVLIAALVAVFMEKTYVFYDVAPQDVKALHEAMEKAMAAMGENIKKTQDLASNALEEVRKEGTLHAKTNEQLAELGKTGNELSEGFKELKARMTDVEQKSVKNPANDVKETKSGGQIVANSEQFKTAMADAAKGRYNMDAVSVGSFHKTQIINATGQNQPLVQAQRLGGIVTPITRRLTIRDLLPNNTTQSNLIEFASETLFTNNAGAQGGPTSPVGNGEGENKPESAITFQLNNTPVCLIAHWIPASRQVLSDAPQLQGYIDGRLRYGLALKEEDELLTGDGGAGILSGLQFNATAFNGGVTNQTALDTLLKAFLQISLQNMEATGVVLHPTDWTNIQLLKDTTGRYLFSDPHGVEAPRVWGKDVVATASQTSGQFLAGAFSQAAELFDREDATVRIAEQHSDFFVKNMVAILAEERLALVTYRSAAIVKGAISYAG